MLTYRLDDQGGPQPPPQPGWKPKNPTNPDEDKQGDEQEEKPQ